MRGIFLTTLVLALISCGGEDFASPPTSGGEVPAPTPAPGVLNTGEVKLTASSTLIAASLEFTSSKQLGSNLGDETDTGSTSDRSTELNSPSFSLSYTSTAGYGIADASNSASFGPERLEFEDDSTVLFALTDPVQEKFLALYKPEARTTKDGETATVSPKLAGTGGWQVTTIGESSSRTRLNFFAYGPTTPVAAMPQSGIAKYTIFNRGNYARDDAVFYVEGGITLTVNFDNGTVKGSLGGVGRNLFSGGSAGLIVANIDGTIVGNQSGGPTISTRAVHDGEYRLFFVGPAAEEVIITYVGSDLPDNYVGAIVGVKNRLAI